MDEFEKKGIRVNFYFDEELHSFVVEVESEETMEIEDLASVFQEFGKGLKTGDVPLFDAADEVTLH